MNRARDAERAGEVQDALAQILEVAARADSLGEVLRTTYEQLGRVMENSNFYVALYDPESALYSFPFSVDTDDDDFTPQPLTGSLTDYVRRTGRSLLADDVAHRALVEAGEVAYVGGYSPIWLGVPLHTADGCFGAAVVQSYSDPNCLDDRDRQVLEMVCNGVSSAIAAAWARESAAAQHRLEVKRLRNSRDQALRASEAKSSFLANMSHELRTPLNAIIGYAELGLEELEDARAEVGVHELQSIHGAAHHLLRVIDEILDLSRVEAGKETVREESFSLGELAEDVRRLATPLVEGAKVQFSIVSRAPEHRLRTDRAKLLQVVMNLVGNGCKFAAGRSLTVRLGCDEAEGGPTWVEVADTGEGIEPAELERMFLPFEQAATVSGGRQGGSGLGLAISRRYCELLGGTLTARSLPGQGSTFRVELGAPGSESLGG